MNLNETKAVLSILRTMENELAKAVDRAEAGALLPTPFEPASDEFANAANNMKDLPFSPEEVQQALDNVQTTIERQEYAAQMGAVATNVVGKLKELVPLLFTL